MKKAILCVMVVVVFSIVTGCAANEVPMEYGFTESGDPDTTYRCAYRLEQSEFQNKNSVFIKVFYGHLFETHPTNPDIVYRIHFVGTELSDPWYETAYFVKEISSNEFASEDYSCAGVEIVDGKKVLSFQHSETLQIPAVLFDRVEGSISFLFTEYLLGPNIYGSGKSSTVNFKMQNETVILSVPQS